MKSRSWTIIIGVALAALWSGSHANALFIRPDLEKIPVERLVKNLEELSQKNPMDAHILYNLARVHAMAYASKTDECQIWKDQPRNGAWFGHTPPVLPFTLKETKDDKEKEAALAHLEKAIKIYRGVLKLQPDYLPAELGLAWSREQNGEKKKAILGYRRVVDKGWEKEKERKSGPLGGSFLTVEAGKYLLPLLDPTTDREEIQTIKDRTAQLSRLSRPITPLVIPLADGLSVHDLEDRQARVAFDADGTGLPQTRTWITPKAGWLVYAPKGQEKITSGLQMFGSVGFWLFWEHGYQALQTLDDNGDGKLDGNELRNLAIWCDANGNGICDPGEVRPLSAYGIVALSCNCKQDPTHPDRIWYSPQGVTFADGTHRPTYDIILHTAQGKPEENPAKKAIRQVLDDQTAAWNKGNLEGFMEGYWKSPDLRFYSGKDVTHGWQPTLDRYRKKYQGQGKVMGTLSFSELEIDVLSSDSAVVRGRWQVVLAKETVTGLFTLVCKKMPEGWRIVHDHTS